MVEGSGIWWLAVALVTITSSARLARLATIDSFPPVKWLRDAYGAATDNKYLLGWQELAYCPWCFSFWATLGVVLWGHLSGWCELWWVLNGALGGSYLAAILVAHDGDDSETMLPDDTDEVVRYSTNPFYDSTPTAQAGSD